MISVFELFKIGIGPSSSHTVGPMRAAASFLSTLTDAREIDLVTRVRTELFGSLAWTGKGHGTDRAAVLGLAGEMPDTVDADRAEVLWSEAVAGGKLLLGGYRHIAFTVEDDLIFDTLSPTPQHPNTMAFTAYDAGGNVIRVERWCSVGGGFVARESEVARPPTAPPTLPYAFRTGKGLLTLCQKHGLSIADIVLANESAMRPAAEVAAHMDAVIDVMMACIDRGMRTHGELPGGLKVKRRAAKIFETLEANRHSNSKAQHEVMDWISLYAIAVNEENAAGGRVVTAPTNGAAGVLPAVLRYYRDHCPPASPEGMRTFLLTATAIGSLCKMNASISGAEVGCQGEVGSACSMAAAGLAAALGGTPRQVENAAEIGMEHHLGMTCDPIGGLVQIPCIERNAFGAVKAINAASLALLGDGTHLVTLDQVIATMRQTGEDMQSKYRETSQGGLAVNYVEC
jgi:L-serine dehydratase